MKHKSGKIRITIENESNLTSIVDTSLSRWSLAAAALIVVALMIFIGTLIVLLTPIHTLLPGYLKENQRAATEENLLRLDSLHNVYETNQRYIRNFLRITDIDRLPMDTTDSFGDTIPPIVKDSLMLPSSRERKFVQRMEEQERFNISVLAPLAANGMVFSSPSDLGIFSSDSKESEIGEILLPQDGAVLSVADGTVIASYYSPADKGYVMLIQHDRGFVSRYSHLGAPLANVGESVEAAQCIAAPTPPDSRGKRTIYIRMWHNAIPVVPYKFIHDKEIENKIETFSSDNSFEAPRGR